MEKIRVVISVQLRVIQYYIMHNMTLHTKSIELSSICSYGAVIVEIDQNKTRQDVVA